MPLARLAEAIDETVDVAAFSVVQMSTGELADLDAILAAADAHDVLTVADASQAAGWLRSTPRASASSSPSATSGCCPRAGRRG